MAFRLHILTTDSSAFSLLDILAEKIEASCIIIPSNRENSAKVIAVKKEAIQRGIPISVHQKQKPFDAKLPVADLAVSWMYSQIIKPEDISRYKFGAINMHGGKIPEYRGANVLQWAIINGEITLNVAWHLIVGEVDAGDIISEGEIPIAAESTAWEVRCLMLEKGISLFPEALQNCISGHKIRKPVLSDGKVWPSRSPEDGRIELNLPERKVRDLIRALCPPWPRAFITINEENIPIASVSLKPSDKTIPYRTAEGVHIYLRRAI